MCRAGWRGARPPLRAAGWAGGSSCHLSAAQSAPCRPCPPGREGSTEGWPRTAPPQADSHLRAPCWPEHHSHRPPCTAQGRGQAGGSVTCQGPRGRGSTLPVGPRNRPPSSRQQGPWSHTHTLTPRTHVGSRVHTQPLAQHTLTHCAHTGVRSLACRCVCQPGSPLGPSLDRAAPQLPGSLGRPCLPPCTLCKGPSLGPSPVRPPGGVWGGRGPPLPLLPWNALTIAPGLVPTGCPRGAEPATEPVLGHRGQAAG